MKYILALDQGTTSSRAILLNHRAQIVSLEQLEFPQHYPQPGWVEHDAMDIWRTQLACAQNCLRKAGVSASEASAIGVTNQRETTDCPCHRLAGPPYGSLLHGAAEKGL